MAKVWLSLMVVVLLVAVPQLSGRSLLYSSVRSKSHREAVTFFKARLKNTLSAPSPSSSTSSSSSSSSSSLSSGFTCETCKAFFAVVRYLYDRGFVRDDIAKICLDVCTSLQIEDSTVCSGVISLFKVS